MHRDECPLFDLNLSVCCNWNILDVFDAQLRNLVSIFFAQSDRIICKFEFLFHEDSQYTGIWKHCGVYKILRCV